MPITRRGSLIGFIELRRIWNGSLLSADDLRSSGAFETTLTGRGGQADQAQRDMLDDADEG